MKSRDIRQSFLDFFAAKGHTIVRSAPVIPAEDPTLLFTNAGMNQFKDVFLDKGSRSYSRAVDTQKCIRASGKHNDLEDVGRDTYHHTFFEMLGNWSFGDYYKKEAISWAWELLTEVWKLPRERLYATVYHDDEESFDLWRSVTDIDPDHILKFGDKDNFWEMGETGPCGPCSEIHIDLTEDMTGGELVNAGDYRVIELWNLVFIQYNRQPDGSLEPLPNRHVDTGMGFERVTAVLQQKTSNYDTDIFKPLFDAITEITGVGYKAELDDEQDIAMRVLADHARALTFAITDGAMPGNEGRGYVLRRILRRALRYARKLDFREPLIHKLVGVIAETMGDVFPELGKQYETVQKIVRAEEESFLATLDRGMDIFADITASLKAAGGTVISGPDAFKLYDTYGFPVDLTRLMAAEEGLQVDEQGFETCMQEQKERARSDRREKQQLQEDGSEWNWLLPGHSHSAFCGYEELDKESCICAMKISGGRLLLVLEETPFYAESGGQVGDTGVIENKRYRFSVEDTRKDGDMIYHVIGQIADAETSAELRPQDIRLDPATLDVRALVDAERRRNTERNHTATHLLHAALRTVLGDHVQQKGSLVTPDRLRFDFSHFEKLSDRQLAEVEAIVNREVREARKLVQKPDVPYEEALDMGALAFFGDKYADHVRIVEVPGVSMELCGGTHVSNIGKIGLFKITGESSVAAGIRRLEAVTGQAAEELLWNEYQELQQIRQLLKAHQDEGVAMKVQELLDEKKTLGKQVQEIQLSMLLQSALRQLESAEEVNGCRIFTMTADRAGADELRSLGQYLHDRIGCGAGLIAAESGGKVSLVAFAGPEAVRELGIDAGTLIKKAAAEVQGGGGGKPGFATAGGRNASGIANAFETFRASVREALQ
ncbi:alanine--tRNA ligase [Prosthecochloris sp. HL-130-GSB]|jgi:alanyl-tRNA synthetase|uniref:alanine--tRNA ligase n=1 Tax=Prosthecochloris sp. HL-130-GSB TaxID=1974213 RepID=UPI000A1C1042|nr:alanine--tRNA ligase [Prosthecochloris sp. HL-130-GSB]ARM30227.1 alanine--tRNA ligase [Prosthecochloris sp. HL-130-GSB]